MIVDPSIALPTRCVRTHEAGHYVVALLVGLTPQWPVVRDGEGHVDYWPGESSPDSSIEAFDKALIREALEDRCVMAMAGCAAEAKFSRSPWQHRRLILDGSDLRTVELIREEFWLTDSELMALWQRARTLIDENWALVTSVADSLKVDLDAQSHREPRAVRGDSRGGTFKEIPHDK